MTLIYEQVLVTLYLKKFLSLLYSTLLISEKTGIPPICTTYLTCVLKSYLVWISNARKRSGLWGTEDQKCKPSESSWIFSSDRTQETSPSDNSDYFIFCECEVVTPFTKSQFHQLEMGNAASISWVSYSNKMATWTP